MIKIEKIIHGTPLITIWFADKEISDKGIVVYNESKNAFSGSIEFVTLVSDLTLSKEELLAKCAQNCRYKVRRAYRENVEVIMKDSKQITDEDISTFLEFFEIFWKSKDVNFDSKDSLRDEMIAYRNAGALYITQAVIDGELAVYHTYLGDENQVRLFHSASLYRLSSDADGSKKNVVGMANRMLHMEDMYYFKDCGIKVYDWGGAGTAEDVASITEFKKSFGGDEIVFYGGQATNGIKAKAVNALSRMKHIIKR